MVVLKTGSPVFVWSKIYIFSPILKSLTAIKIIRVQYDELVEN